ncbi:hypothetical protein KI440_00110 [Candidatus Saccharibacteria bacterium TM7i]|nr:hypothetical protein KI440_00110 [Candidatus Saccharibacteria bacterium TM7i]
MKQFIAYIAVGFFALFVAAPFAATISPAPTASAACTDRLLGVPTWYRGLTTGADCTVEMPSGGSDEIGGFVWKLALNIIEMVLVVVVYIAVGFILYGGFLFISGGGNPGTVEKARKSILNAVIGLVIAMAAIAIVNFIFGVIK